MCLGSGKTSGRSVGFFTSEVSSLKQHHASSIQQRWSRATNRLHMFACLTWKRGWIDLPAAIPSVATALGACTSVLAGIHGVTLQASPNSIRSGGGGEQLHCLQSQDRRPHMSPVARTAPAPVLPGTRRSPPICASLDEISALASWPLGAKKTTNGGTVSGHRSAENGTTPKRSRLVHDS